MSKAAGQTSRRSRDLQRDAVALQAAVADLVRVYQFRDRDRICCHDISVTQCHALETLVGHAPLRLSELADRLFLDKSTTSRVVGTLVKKGYVEQRGDKADGRAIALHVTASGKRLYQRITADLVEQQKALLQDLDPDVRDGVVNVIRGLARAADSRFRSGVSVGGCCAPDIGAPPSGRSRSGRGDDTL
jgi:MarR family 2-MHQ and catechol resistance regulon transcriptional repressor